jgi:hypothetical protein
MDTRRGFVASGLLSKPPPDIEVFRRAIFELSTQRANGC